MNEDTTRKKVLAYLETNKGRAYSIRVIARSIGKGYNDVWRVTNYLYSRCLIGRIEFNRRETKFFFITNGDKD